MKEAVDVLIVSNDAVADNKISTEEASSIQKEIKEMIAAFKILIGKAA